MLLTFWAFSRILPFAFAMLALSKCRIYCCFCPTPPYANCPLKTNCDTLLLSSALTLQRIAHNGNGWIWNGKRELSIVEPRMCVFATVNENPLKIASSCIRVILSVCHTFCHWYSDAYASKQLSPRAVLLHCLSAFSSVLCPSSPPSWVLCAPTYMVHLFVSSSSHSHHHFMCLYHHHPPHAFTLGLSNVKHFMWYWNSRRDCTE